MAPIAIYVLFCMCACDPSNTTEGRWLIENHQRIEEKMGIGFGTPYIRIDGEWVEVLAVEKLWYDSSFKDAGVNVGDLIDYDENEIKGSVHKWLFEHQGETVKLILRAGGDGPAITMRQSKIVSITLPRIGIEGPVH